MNYLKCPGCGKQVHDGAPACPQCGTKIDVESPGDMKRVRHAPLDLPPPSPSVTDPREDRKNLEPD